MAIKELLGSDEWCDATIIVSRNNLREHLNKIKLFQFANKNNSNIYLTKAIDLIKKNGIKTPLITKSVEKAINKLEENDTNNLMTNLLLVPKARYFITTNLSTKKGIVNGAEITLEKIFMDDYTSVDMNISN